MAGPVNNHGNNHGTWNIDTDINRNYRVINGDIATNNNNHNVHGGGHYGYKPTNHNHKTNDYDVRGGYDWKNDKAHVNVDVYAENDKHGQADYGIKAHASGTF